jgi:hypothetical protein
VKENCKYLVTVFKVSPGCIGSNCGEMQEKDQSNWKTLAYS